MIETGSDAFLSAGYPASVGGVRVVSPIWLAPLAGITTSSLRQFHRELGAGLVHTEMVSALGLIHGGRKTREYLRFDEAERPIVLQLFGPDADSLGRGAEIALSAHRYDGLQVNMACPMPKVTKKGAGSKMLDSPLVARDVVRRLGEFGVPLWIKIRLLPPSHPMTTEALCDLLFEAGADLMIVHGRTAAQRYEGIANRQEVCRIARKFPARIVGSGDYYAPSDAEEFLRGGCAAVIAARGIVRDVLLIPKTLRALGFDTPQTQLSLGAEEQADALLLLGERALLREGEGMAQQLARRMLAGLFKGFPGAAALRQEFARLRTWAEMRDALLYFKGAHKSGEDRIQSLL